MNDLNQNSIVELNSKQTEDFRKWLSNPNGAHSSNNHVVFEAVEGGGILIRVFGYDSRRQIRRNALMESASVCEELKETSGSLQITSKKQMAELCEQEIRKLIDNHF